MACVGVAVPGFLGNIGSSYILSTKGEKKREREEGRERDFLTELPVCQKLQEKNVQITKFIFADKS